jgi:fructose-bisphosphate aldolase class II
MAISPLKDIVADALDRRYGVPAINVFNDLTMSTVLKSAEAVRSPVIIQTSVKTVRSIGAKTLFAMWSSMTSEITVPVALHLDHCPDRSVISECLAEGWNSVLFDASHLAVEENLQQTIDVVTEARKYGAHVEGEIEAITGVEDGHGSDAAAARESLEVTLDFIDRTGVDVFAPSIGNAHGSYKATPIIDFDRVSEIESARHIPIALHGGSGLTLEQFRELIARGCAKVNISTSLKETYMKSSLEYLDEARLADKWDPPTLFSHVEASIHGLVADLAEQFGSSGRA